MDAVDKYTAEEPKGEYVLVIEGRSREELERESAASWEAMTLIEHLEYYLDRGMDKKEAMDKGLRSSSFTGFYHLCRCLLVNRTNNEPNRIERKKYNKTAASDVNLKEAIPEL